jgi:quinol monooxygenase YgiN
LIYVIATTKVKPGNLDAFIEGHKKCIAETRKEKGCIAYEGHTSIHDPNSYVVVERWETREDLNAHGRAPHLKAWREYSTPLRLAPPVIEIISGGKVEKL